MGESSMGNEADNKFTWVIKNFSSLESEKIYSPSFVIGGCKWRLLAFPKGDWNKSCFALYLVVADSKTLPSGWRRHTKFSFTIVNEISENLSQQKKIQHWFDQKTTAIGYSALLPLTKLNANDGGFLVNDQVKIVAGIDVIEDIGILDEFTESNQPVKKIKREDNNNAGLDLLNETSPMKQSIDVNGFQVLPSQVEFVRRVFKKYPEFALELRERKEPLRTACMYVFLSLIKSLCKSLQELSKDDPIEAENALTYLKNSGINVDWLEKKLEEVKEKKKEEKICESRMQELEKELKGFKQKCVDIEASLENERAKVLAARSPALTLDDVV